MASRNNDYQWLGELSEPVEDVYRALRSGKDYVKGYGGLKFKTLTNVPLTKPEWIWEGMIAKGKLHTFAGESGIGKTQILVNIAAIVSRGGFFPNSKKACQAGPVLYLSGEDGLSDTIGPRFKACGGDPDNLIWVTPTLEGGDVVELPTHLENLKGLASDKKAKILICDPISSFMANGFDNNSVTSVRKVATKLEEFSKETGTAVIALTHLTKGVQTKSMHRILGSGAWVHAPRIVLGATVHEGRYLFGKWKANIADTKPVFQYQMVTQKIDDFDVIVIDWSDEVLLDKCLGDFDMFADTGRGDKGELALEVLRENLSGGQWHLSRDVITRVRREVSISERQIKRLALESLKVETRRERGIHGHTSWRLIDS